MVHGLKPKSYYKKYSNFQDHIANWADSFSSPFTNQVRCIISSQYRTTSLENSFTILNKHIQCICILYLLFTLLLDLII